MAIFRVTHIRKSGSGSENISWLGNPSENWLLSAEQAIRFLQNRTHIFYIERFDSISPLGIYKASSSNTEATDQPNPQLAPPSELQIRSFSEGKWNDWLAQLPEYPLDQILGKDLPNPLT